MNPSLSGVNADNEKWDTPHLRLKGYLRKIAFASSVPSANLDHVICRLIVQIVRKLHGYKIRRKVGCNFFNGAPRSWKIVDKKLIHNYSQTDQSSIIMFDRLTLIGSSAILTSSRCWFVNNLHGVFTKPLTQISHQFKTSSILFDENSCVPHAQWHVLFADANEGLDW